MRQHAKNLTAFVLAGGGSLGAVQVGMLAALTRQGVVPDLIVGASVGAITPRITPPSRTDAVSSVSSASGSSCTGAMYSRFHRSPAFSVSSGKPIIS